MWDLGRGFYCNDLARSRREGQLRIGHNVAFGPPPQLPQFGENELSRNSRLPAHCSLSAQRILAYGPMVNVPTKLTLREELPR
jgi:hypothetical protein